MVTSSVGTAGRVPSPESTVGEPSPEATVAALGEHDPHTAAALGEHDPQTAAALVEHDPQVGEEEDQDGTPTACSARASMETSS